MSTQPEKIKLDDILNQIADQEKRENLKAEFIKLEQLNQQQPERLIAEFTKLKERHEKNIIDSQNKINDIEGSTTKDEFFNVVETGLHLLRSEMEEAEDIVEKERLKHEIEQQEQTIANTNKSIKDSREHIVDINQKIEAAKLIASNLKTQTQMLQSALTAMGFNNPILHKVDNINRSSIQQTLSSPRPDTTPRHWTQRDEARRAKAGYIDHPEPLTTNLADKGFNATKLANPPPPTWLVNDSNNLSIKIENHKVTCPASKNDKKSLIAMYTVFEECERNKFIAQGNNPADFETYKAKIKPVATGEAAEELLKICHERGCGTAYLGQNARQLPPTTPPTNLSNDEPSRRPRPT